MSTQSRRWRTCCSRQVMSIGRGKAQALSMMIRSEDEGPHGNIVKIRVLKALFESAEEVPE